jgi:LysM repeat protein
MDVVDQNYVNYNPDKGSPAARHALPINSRLTALIRPNYAPNQFAGSQPGKYTIQKGDTLWDLERQNGWAGNTLVSLNPGIDPRRLQVGQQIIIPGGNPPLPTPPNKPAEPAPQPQQRTHVVENGENLSVIAARYGISNWRQIYDIPQNKAAIGNNPSLIHPGTAHSIMKKFIIAILIAAIIAAFAYRANAQRPAANMVDVPACRQTAHPDVCATSFHKCDNIDLDETCLLARMDGEAGYDIISAGENKCRKIRHAYKAIAARQNCT